MTSALYLILNSSYTAIRRFNIPHSGFNTTMTNKYGSTNFQYKNIEVKEEQRKVSKECLSKECLALLLYLIKNIAF